MSVAKINHAPKEDDAIAYWQLIRSVVLQFLFLGRLPNFYTNARLTVPGENLSEH